MPQTEPHVLTGQEMDRVIAEIVEPNNAVVTLQAYGGLRIGEAFALRQRLRRHEIAVEVKTKKSQVVKATLVSPARSHKKAAPSPKRIQRIAERTNRDPIWRSK
jgi:hypothetical protein